MDDAGDFPIVGPAIAVVLDAADVVVLALIQKFGVFAGFWVEGPQSGGVTAVVGFDNKVTRHAGVAAPDPELVKGIFMLALEFYPVVALGFPVVPDELAALGIKAPGQKGLSCAVKIDIAQ